jgi:hypothetical protein
MRTKLLAVCLLGLCVSGCGGSDSPTGPSTPQPQGPQTQQPTSIAGVWTGTAISTQIAGARFNITVVLTQNGTEISGTFSCAPTTPSNCAAPSATVAGTVNGSALTARVLLPGDVVACSSFNGTLSSTTAMSGTYACGNVDAGTWSLTK